MTSYWDLLPKEIANEILDFRYHEDIKEWKKQHKITYSECLCSIIKIGEKDIELVMDHSHKNKKQSIKALLRTNGDIVDSIIYLDSKCWDYCKKHKVNNFFLQEMNKVGIIINSPSFDDFTLREKIWRGSYEFAFEKQRQIEYIENQIDFYRRRRYK